MSDDFGNILTAEKALPLDGGGLGGGGLSGKTPPFANVHPTQALPIKGREKI
jgi:hypothetical protein